MILFLLFSLVLFLLVIAYIFLKKTDLKKWQFLSIIILTPILLILSYQKIGTPNALSPQQVNSEIANTEELGSGLDLLTENQITADQIQNAIVSLEARIIESPDDIEGLNLLTNTYLISNQTEKAVVTLEKLISLGQDDPETLLKAVDAYAFVEQGVFNSRAQQLLNKAMQQAPDNPQGLWLSGMAAMQNNEVNKAKEFWTRLLPIFANTPQEQQLKDILNELEGRDNNNNLLAENQPQNDIENAPVIRIAVNLGSDFSELNPYVHSENFVFIIARAKGGSNVPLAVKRLTVGELPAIVELSTQDAMIANNSIGDFNEINISAKISISGDPTNTEDDINSTSIEVNTDNLENQYSLEFN